MDYTTLTLYFCILMDLKQTTRSTHSVFPNISTFFTFFRNCRLLNIFILFSQLQLKVYSEYWLDSIGLTSLIIETGKCVIYNVMTIREKKSTIQNLSPTSEAGRFPILPFKSLLNTDVVVSTYTFVFSFSVLSLHQHTAR